MECGGRGGVAVPRAGADGPADVVIAPGHVSVALPDGPNGVGSWTARIAGLEAAGDDVHIRVGGPVPIAAMASLESLRDLHLSPGAMVDVHVDPSHLKVFDAVTSLDVPRSAQTTNAPAP